MGKTWTPDLIPHFSAGNWDFPRVQRSSQKFQVHHLDWGIPVLRNENPAASLTAESLTISEEIPEKWICKAFPQASQHNYYFKTNPKQKKLLWCNKILPSWAPREAQKVNDSLLQSQTWVGLVAALWEGWQWHPAAARVGTALCNLNFRALKALATAQGMPGRKGAQQSSSLPSSLQFYWECLGENLNYT